MASLQVCVTFQPQGRVVHVLGGTKVLEAAAEAGLTLETPCGGGGTCGKCRVQIVSGACPPGEADGRVFNEQELRDGWRLACQTSICGPTVIHVPSASLFADGHQIVTASQTESARQLLPAVRKVPVELPSPTLASAHPDLLSLEEKLGPIRGDLSLLRRLPALLRKNNFRGTAVLTDHRLIDFESGDTSARCYGLAVDIGTTTLAASLMDLCSGEEVALTAAMNAQVRFGDDVLSRINYASAGGARELAEALVADINEMIGRLCAESGIPRTDIYEVSLAGNTTMEHLLCGLDVEPLGQVPFVPTCGRGLMLAAADLGILIHGRGGAYVFPVIGGFVGGDTVAGMLATRIAETDGPVLMVDIGTNGEIVLAHEGRILAASTAAGPAFEGARISRGMRATRGAIEKVVIEGGDLRWGVIGDVEPLGLCGSGLIDLAAELLRVGVIDYTGRLCGSDELPADLPPAMGQRVGRDDKGGAIFVLGANGGTSRPPLTLTQKDVRELQLAAGAIRAGISILLKQAGLATGDLQRVLIAGGFGSFIRRSNAQRIGLLPADVDHRRIQYIGNASLAGAKWALLSTAARQQGEDLARRAIHVELSQDCNFQMEFAEAMIFPQQG
ncbi:MAG: ASKHA domain-containing protein [Phycisphaerae bacterium]|jgi:uncharacterized 2Fe-2S/4Fe-4S cluster protein (DUF4445 family)